MKKKIWVPVLILVLLAILMIPIPSGVYKDGGTRVYSALTYKIVDWNRLHGDGVFDETKVYFLPKNFSSVDALWKEELKNLPQADSSGSKYEDYNEVFLDKAVAVKYENDTVENIVITEIYGNCFFAQYAWPSPYVLKLNGTLSDDWCVGDQVSCTIENGYADDEKHLMEADFLTVEISTWQQEPFAAYKPVIYLYPEAETEVAVKLALQGELTCTYPAYHDGWQVTAAPDGTLTDAKGQTYSYLYWEGETNAQWDMTEGFCIKGEDTAAFLEEALAKLGLNRKEANEFIVYWLPQMEKNPYNIISFQEARYEEAAKLDIAPAPDTVIRVFMTWKASESYKEIPAQTLSAPERKGFTAIEWGGTEIK